MPEMVCYTDIADAMDRSTAVFKAFASLSKPRNLSYKNVKLGGGKQPTRFYAIDDTVRWLAQSYAHFDGGFEHRLRQIARENSLNLFGDSADA